MRKLDGYYEIQYDSAARLVRIVTRGFWTLKVVDRFAADIEAVIDVAGADCDNLAISTDNEVHSPEVAKALERLAQEEKRSFTGRIALVSPSNLLKMQNRRFLGGGRFGYFASEEEALRWLASKDGRNA